ncbi:cyclic nucleotide-binding domain-containing protein [Phreatobacter aquaticus]|uniref:Cyclic nucleotide-binding domain-containing protein n=1 Tax=Phreatobacter aquaticus TaxID=2570229 RepID=A0A4D7QVM2_9HYPH|nr:cyclic nucleotide-gated ion channel [Phreatobacter aquaticus]QCK88022.1 cyclic nucleotide-binding domain-containing protein [Phreatobacter aquaticus]
MDKAHWRRRTYEILDQGMVGDRVAVLVHRTLVFLILVNVTAVVLESVPSLRLHYAVAFTAIEAFSVAVFTLEYAARLWSSVEHVPLAGRAPWRARLAALVSPSLLIDLLAIMPFYLALVVPADLRVILLLRLLRFFKLARYSPGLSSLADAFWSERRALVACLVIFLGALIVAASAMHLVEHEAQPEKFGSIPETMWWAAITLTTVGYGDVYPVTPLGKLVATITAMFGLVMLALPGGIIATAFTREIQRHDFVVTWSMVARVPLFAGMDAASIAEVMRVLKSATFEPGAVICRRSDPAHSMYLIAEGEVEVRLPKRTLVLTKGQFFGEIAVLHRVERSATIIARGRVKLLALDATDLHHLMLLFPSIDAVVRATASQRLSQELVEPQGDLVREELEQPPRS